MVFLWKKTFNYSPVHGGGSSPVFKILIFSADGAENPRCCSNKKNGSIAWKSKFSDAKKNFSFLYADHSARRWMQIIKLQDCVFRTI